MIDLTGKKDVVFLKDRYQNKLDEITAAIKNKRDFYYTMNHKLKNAIRDMHRSSKDIAVEIEERDAVYKNIYDSLIMETDYERSFFKSYIEGIKGEIIKINQNYKDADIDTITGQVNTFMDKYPEYASKSSFKEKIDQIKILENNIKNTKKIMNLAYADGINELAYFKRNFVEYWDLVNKYDTLLEEGTKKINDCRYMKSRFYNLLSEEEKQALAIDIIDHHINEFSNTVHQLEDEVKEAKTEIENLMEQFKQST